MKEKETLKSKIQREAIREELEKTKWNVFLTLHFRDGKFISFDNGHRIINDWDKKVSREMVGRKYNHETYYNRRMAYFGCSGYNEQNQLHTHLLVKVPLEWNTETRMKNFRYLVGKVFSNVGGKDFDFQVIGNTDKDRNNVIRYTTENRHLSIDNVGQLGCSIITSPNYTMGKL